MFMLSHANCWLVVLVLNCTDWETAADLLKQLREVALHTVIYV
jgi:hypothetical protein